MDAGAGGGGGLVDVDFLHGGAGAWGDGGAADGVVEDEDAGGVAGDGGQEEGFDFGVVGFLDGGVGGEVGF